MARRIQKKTAAATPVVTLDDMRDYLRVDGTDEDSHIKALISAATLLAENWTGRAFIDQTWIEIHTPIKADPIDLQRLPARAIESAKYINPNDGSETVIDSGDMNLITEAGRLYIYASQTISASILHIEYTAGYGPAASDVPPDIIEAVKQAAAYLYENRGAGDLPPIARTLLGPYYLVLI